MHSWIDDPHVEILRDLALYLNSPNATKRDTPMLARLHQPLVLPINSSSGILEYISLSGLESFKVTDIATTTQPQVLRMEMELANVSVAVNSTASTGDGVVVAVAFAPLKLSLETTIALGQSQLEPLEMGSSTLWSFEHCCPDAIDSATIQQLNVSYSHMQIGISTDNREFDENFK